MFSSGLKTVLVCTALLAATAAAATRNDNQKYIKLTLSLGRANSLTDPLEPTACPAYKNPLNNMTTPFPWNVQNTSNPTPLPTFYIALGACLPLYLPYDNNLLPVLQSFYRADWDNSTGTPMVQFKYFCTNSTCNSCGLDVTVTQNACNADTDRRFVNIPGNSRNAIVYFTQDFTQANLRAGLSATPLYFSGSQYTATITEQFADKGCGIVRADPVLYRTGYVVDTAPAATGYRSVDCYIGAFSTTQSYLTQCSIDNSTGTETRRLSVTQHTDDKCNTFNTTAGATPSGAIPAQPSTAGLRTGSTSASKCATTGCNSNFYLSTYTWCAGAAAPTAEADYNATCNGNIVVPTVAPPATTGGSTTGGATSGVASVAASLAVFAAALLAALLL